MAADDVNTRDLWTDIHIVAARVLRPGATGDEVTALYNEWARRGTYDQSLQEKEEYGAPKVMQATMKELFPAKRDSIRVLDVGAGTGLCGLVLQEAGFTNVDALDPAQEMLKAAQDKGVYRNILNVFLTGQPIDVPADTYDAIVLVGVIQHGSLPCEAFEEMVRLVKPGGYIVNCMRAAFLTEIPQYAEKWEPLVARLEREGKWKVVKMERYPNHFLGNEGMHMVFHVC